MGAKVRAQRSARTVALLLAMVLLAIVARPPMCIAPVYCAMRYRAKRVRNQMEH